MELGHSLRDWLGRIGVSVGGRTGKLVKDQAERISRCRLTFHLQGAKSAGLINQSIVDRALFIEDGDVTQGRLSLETAKLSEGFFEQLRRHPVPLEEAAIRAINNNPAALDCYLWLAYRLHALTAPRLVTWKATEGSVRGGLQRSLPFQEQVVANTSDGAGGVSGCQGGRHGTGGNPQAEPATCRTAGDRNQSGVTSAIEPPRWSGGSPKSTGRSLNRYQSIEPYREGPD